MNFQKQTWLNNSAPALNAMNLNRIEDGIEESLTEIANTNQALNDKIVVGSYTGDNKATRTISLGFTPKAVVVVYQGGIDNALASGIYSGLALPSNPCGKKTSDHTYAIEIVNNGFKVAYYGYNRTSSPFTNRSENTYYYIAIR